MAGKAGADRDIAAFFGADTDDFLDGGDKDLPVADLAGPRPFDDGRHDLGDPFIGHDDLQFDLGQEIDRVFGAAIDLGVALLAAEAFHLGQGHALDAEFAEGVFHFLDLEGLDDGFDFLHPQGVLNTWNAADAAKARAS